MISFIMTPPVTTVQELASYAETAHFELSIIRERTQVIHDTVLRASSHLNGANFTAIHPQDLAQLFDLYDRAFLQGLVRKAIGDAPLDFRLSPRMTSAAGKMTRFGVRNSGRVRYEIAVSTTLLFQTFRDVERQVQVSGIICTDRLQALQRVFEHELIHLVEMVAWNDSSCAQKRFQSMAFRLFGHTHHQHQLITPRERAFKKYGFRPGSRVRFPFEGKLYRGVVNRITKRATVLVEDPRGEAYSNGKRYARFYVPLESLEPDD